MCMYICMYVYAIAKGIDFPNVTTVVHVSNLMCVCIYIHQCYLDVCRHLCMCVFAREIIWVRHRRPECHCDCACEQFNVCVCMYVCMYAYECYLDVCRHLCMCVFA